MERILAALNDAGVAYALLANTQVPVDQLIASYLRKRG